MNKKDDSYTKNAVVSCPFYSILGEQDRVEAGYWSEQREFSDIIGSSLQDAQWLVEIGARVEDQISCIIDQSSRVFNSQKELHVLYSTGAYNPMHYGHVGNFQLAKEVIKSNVQQGSETLFLQLLSPSSRVHLQKKLQSQDIISDSQRVLSIESFLSRLDNSHTDRVIGYTANSRADFKSGGFILDTWEMRQEGLSNFTSIAIRYLASVAGVVNAFGIQKVCVHYLYGSDNAGFNKLFLNLNAKDNNLFNNTRVKEQFKNTLRQLMPGVQEIQYKSFCFNRFYSTINSSEFFSNEIRQSNIDSGSTYLNSLAPGVSSSQIRKKESCYA